MSSSSWEPRAGKRPKLVRGVAGSVDMLQAWRSAGTRESTRMKISDRPVAPRGRIRSPRAWEVALAPEQLAGARGTRAPLYVQIVQAVVRDIRRGRLLAGQELPGSRTRAERLGVHRNTVLSAYAELQPEGWIQTGRARSTRVCEQLPELAAPASR